MRIRRYVDEGVEYVMQICRFAAIYFLIVSFFDKADVCIRRYVDEGIEYVMHICRFAANIFELSPF